MEHTLLWLALFFALGFEFINGFHDTSNAVATVIYTKALKPWQAVLWSGLWNFVGAALSTGAVAYGIVHLLPANLMNSDTIPGVAVIFSFLISAIIWNLGTWYWGLPVSSSHTLIGAILGTGLAASALLPADNAAEAVNWRQLEQAFLSLLISPVLGFVLSFALMKIGSGAAPSDEAAPDGPPKPPMRGLLIFTSMGVSFAHGSNDGQKGMGIVMLILMGLFPGMNAGSGTEAAIPLWVKLIVAVTLGLGTMIGWKRVTQTVGEKIGRRHLTNRQGATAEIVAMTTIMLADRVGLPVSTTHVLSSGVAGTMVANHSGLQGKTVRNIALAWVLTLPVAVLLGAAILSATLLTLSRTFL